MTRIAIIGIIGRSVFLPVERFHEGGETVVATDIHTEWGGKGANQAIAAARHGAAVSFLAAVQGCDVAEVSAFCRENGIDATLIGTEQASPYAVIMTDAAGANHVTVYRGAQLCAADLVAFEKEIVRADVLLLTNEVPTKVNERAIAIARENGVRVILNPAPARELTREICEGVSLFTPNEHELEGLEDEQNVIVTLGGKGCLVRGTQEIIPPVNAGEVLDTTGAGDTFNGVLAVELATGRSVAAACRVANAAAGIKVTKCFVAGAIPTKAQTYQLLEEQNGYDVFSEDH